LFALLSALCIPFFSSVALLLTWQSKGNKTKKSASNINSNVRAVECNQSGVAVELNAPIDSQLNDGDDDEIVAAVEEAERALGIKMVHASQPTPSLKIQRQIAKPLSCTAPQKVCCRLRWTIILSFESLVLNLC